MNAANAIKITLGQFTETAKTVDEAGFVLEVMRKTHPELETAVPTFENIVDPHEKSSPVAAANDATTMRIEAQHEALRAAGIAVDTSKQLYATGTKLAEVGYSKQAMRKAEHESKMTVREACGELSLIVRAEKRQDEVATAGQLAGMIATNGKLTVMGLTLREQAICGLLTRIESPATSYVMGLRDRIAFELAKQPEKQDKVGIAIDKEMISEVLIAECLRKPFVELKLRTRQETGDVFAIVSPSYSPADAPEIVKQFDNRLPSDARASFAYDPATTSWEVRASVWTPTPVAEQAVGEPFEGYMSFRSRDDGQSSVVGGGGIELIRCLNASTYSAGRTTRRVHVGNVMLDVRRLVTESKKAIDVLCDAWGTARRDVVEIENCMNCSDLIAGLFLAELRSSKSELRGVLRGRSVEHARGLAKTFDSERRDESKIVRADLANAWTRYVQDQPSAVRRDAEQAVGAWVVNPKPLAYLPVDAS